MTDWLVPVLIAAGVLLLAAIVFFVVRRNRKASATLPTAPATTATPSTTTAPSDGDQADPSTPGGPAPPLELQTPETVGSRLVRLRSRLSRSGALGQALLAVLSRDTLDEAAWEEMEETLLQADLGLDPTTALLSELRRRIRVEGTRDGAQVRAMLRELLLDQVDPSMDRSIASEAIVGEDGVRRPATILMVGVNGTGKTTTVGKLARLLVAEDRTVVLGAADTFRAAAADQLATWGSRVGVPVVRSDRDGADPASVAHEAVDAAYAAEADVVIIDTAGRLQNKAGLMDELGKIVRVASRRGPITESLLVLDATTGQNGLRQAQVFAEVAQLTGIVLTKLDGSAKGGIVVAVQRQLGIPVKLVGLGEGVDDLAPFDPEGFVDALLG